MAIRNVIVRGRVGFAAGDVKYLFTHGLNIGEAAAATEATAFLEYTTRHARMNYTTKATPFHYTTRSGPLHYVGRQR